MLLLAVICAVTPDVASPLCAFLVTEIEVFQVSELIAVAILLIVLIYYLLFGRLANRQSVVLASVPVLSVLQISYLVPIVGGLFFSPVMIPALISSVFFYFVLCGVQEYACLLYTSGNDAYGKFRNGSGDERHPCGERIYRQRLHCKI